MFTLQHFQCENDNYREQTEKITKQNKCVINKLNLSIGNFNNVKKEQKKSSNIKI